MGHHTSQMVAELLHDTDTRLWLASESSVIRSAAQDMIHLFRDSADAPAPPI
jgi:ligand-binding sensor domain-containing protein